VPLLAGNTCLIHEYYVLVNVIVLINVCDSDRFTGYCLWFELYCKYVEHIGISRQISSYFSEEH